MTTHFSCPVCGEPLARDEKTCFCSNGHSFDRAKQGYVNLLISNRSSVRRRGDDKKMVAARTAFLERGYYEPLRSAVCRAAKAYLPENAVVLDAGCGEGWYTFAVAEALRGVSMLGTDISRDALAAAGRRKKDGELAVASSAHLPIGAEMLDGVLNLFSPLETAEFLRVLKSGGILIRAVPLEEHLFSLKKAVYDTPYRNGPPEEALAGFTRVGYEDVRERIRLCSREDIESLFMMTPYYYKTSAADQQKLSSLTELETELAVRVLVYRK